ncbi:hypothetical protein [Roseospira marina]|nr:hypothetical protein [Roseospira marina]MBB4316100.1 hypothetical protein [Roseospira marina]
MTMLKEDADILAGFVAEMKTHLRSGDRTDLPAALDRTWTVVRLTKADATYGREALCAMLDGLAIKAGWMVTTDAVYIVERNTWSPWRQGKQILPDFGRVLDADLALDDTTGLRVTHLGGTRWRVKTMLEGDETGHPHLMTKDTHYSVLKGRTLRHAVYWREEAVEGNEALRCHQPVAARFLDFGEREVRR